MGALVGHISLSPALCFADCCINCGGFCSGFSWSKFLGTLPHINEEKISGGRIGEKFGGSRLKPTKNLAFQSATLVNVGNLRRNSGECQGGSREYGAVGSPNFAKVRQTSPKFA